MLLKLHVMPTHNKSVGYDLKVGRLKDIFLFWQFKAHMHSSPQKMYASLHLKRSGLVALLSAAVTG